ncbi:Dynamin GTPase effector,Dynamin-type guanine nucleotide-binding (G) domain,Dynamin, GTPase domain,P- [Cinara cedri]|uniref:Dynamin GTPase effector,Dynamin-type guanine nucleotide-binding (G) domain,Dynamin, GTPase domain,P n=1 Tax=Cinara cedri TaxID=506608 RepID=A0A5E4NRQ7_9HEMI|nr:Dynamin GTPase effector,Dynamin-type guanine nucleotide-binding (G) domain,Dynamin, GTPase domain,P- [Cinara cedri]
MDKLISMINRLQEVLNTVEFDTLHLPQIVVVGSQSSGKSSIIESIVGRSFLPKGIGTVTRRPLVLQLVNCPLNDNLSRKAKSGMMNLKEWGEFSHCEKVFTDFNEIREEIQVETNKIIGRSGICPDPIYLKLYSTYMLNFSLVDLPGMTKLPIGDQPEDIEMQIKNLIIQYIKNPNSIILAISSANMDLSTSESLKLSREVDPEGKRTLAVITKLDLMDAGTDAVDVLSGHVIPVKLGIIGVINRSQQETNDNKSLVDALKDESVFLQRKYSLLANRNGTPHLAKTINRILIDQIRNYSPELKTKINIKISELKSVLNSFDNDLSLKIQTKLRTTINFVNTYCSTIDGASENIETSEVCGGARIYYIFNDIFGKVLDSIHPFTGLSKMHVITAIRNVTGTKSELFVPETAFEILVKRQIGRFEQPSLRCVELVHEEMLRMIHCCIQNSQQEFNRFPKLREMILDVVTKMLRNCLSTTNKMIENMVAIETAYINTKHPDFNWCTEFVSLMAKNAEENEFSIKCNNVKNTTNGCSNTGSMEKNPIMQHQADQNNETKCATEYSPAAKPVQQVKNNILALDEMANCFNNSMNLHGSPNRNLTEKEQRNCNMIEALIKSYFYIIRKSIQDSVPKIIMHFLVNFMKTNLQSELITHLYQYERALFEESEHRSKCRKDTVNMLEALRNASQIISDIQEVHYTFGDDDDRLYNIKTV